MDSATSAINGVIITGDLDRRPSRAPDYQAEAQALTALAEAMSANPGTVLQRLVEAAMDLTRSDSAGISLLEPGDENDTFRWVAIAGAWSPYRDGTMPREASPCGEVIAREAVLLMRNPERSFPALLQAEPGISEGLLAPFHLGGVPAGTLWTIKHNPDEHFEAEDARIIKSLARFASAAQQMVQALQLAKAASQQAEVRVQQLVALAEVSSDFFGTCDMEFMPIYGNAAAMRMVGLADLEQVKQTPVQAFFFPEDLPFIIDEFLPRVLREGRGKVEIRFRHFVTGEPVWVDYNLVVLKDAMGRATGLGTVTHDLTERKRAETALRVSEARFRALATAGSSSVYRMSPDWREMRQLGGAAFLANTNEATSDWVDIYIPPDERLRVREAIQRAVAAKDVFELEHRVLRVDGTVGWTFSRAIPLLDDVGNITEWFGAATDVTARVKKDQSFTRLFQASPAPFLILKPDAPHFTIAEVNDAYLSATMRTRDEVVGRGVFEAYPGNPSDETAVGASILRSSLQKVLASRQPDTLPSLKYDIARPDGTFEERWWSPVNSAVLDDDGEVEALIHNANDVTEERRAEVAMRVTEERYLALFNAIDQGFCTIEMAFDENQNPVDYRFLEVSPAFERQTGIEDGAGRWMREIAPDHDQHWFDAYGRVALTGEPARFENFSTPLGRWWEVYAFRVTGPHRVAILFRDITDHKRAEATLRESEERQAFLLKLSDALRPLSDAAEIMATTTRLLGTHMGADRVMYAEVHGEPGAETGTIEGQYVRSSTGETRSATPFPERFTFGPFGAHTMAARYRGETLVVADIAADRAFADSERTAWVAANVRAAVVAALAKEGRLTAEFGVHSAEPRNWTNAEVSLIQEVAERTWAAAERARAETRLRDSEARLQTLMEGIPQLVWRSCDQGLWTWASPQWLDFTGQSQEESRGLGWLDLIHPDDHEATKLAWTEARPHGLLALECRVRRAADGTWIWHHTRSVPVRNEQGHIVEWLGTSTDVQVLKEFQERQGVLVAELQHRTRNLIAIVSSTSDRTSRASADLNDFRTRFRARLDALARVQGLLSRLNDLDRVTFDELIKAELTALDSDPDKVTMEGPSGIRLRSSTVQTLAMALHELATNALKYGALGQPDARLAVTWRWERSGEGGKPWLHIEWRETGVNMAPIGAAPRGIGQGRELIERALPYQLSAKTNYELGPDGVHCTISLHVSAAAAPEVTHD